MYADTYKVQPPTNWAVLYAKDHAKRYDVIQCAIICRGYRRVPRLPRDQLMGGLTYHVIVLELGDMSPLPLFLHAVPQPAL